MRLIRKEARKKKSDAEELPNSSKTKMLIMYNYSYVEYKQVSEDKLSSPRKDVEMSKNEEEDKGSYTEHDAKTEKEASYDKYDDSTETEDKKEEK